MINVAGTVDLCWRPVERFREPLDALSSRVAFVSALPTPGTLAWVSFRPSRSGQSSLDVAGSAVEREGARSELITIR